MIMDLLVAIMIASFETIAIVASLFMITDMSDQDTLNRNVQTILNSSNQSTLLYSKVDDGSSLKTYNNDVLFAYLDDNNSNKYFSDMRQSVLDQSVNSIIYRKKVNNFDYDFFIVKFKTNVSGKFSTFQGLTCFGVYKKEYDSIAQMNALVHCSEGEDVSMDTYQNGVFPILYTYSGKKVHFVLTFDTIDKTNAY